MRVIEIPVIRLRRRQCHCQFFAPAEPKLAHGQYRNIGTVANLAVFNRLGVLPAHNFQQSTFDDSDALSGENPVGNQFCSPAWLRLLLDSL